MRELYLPYVPNDLGEGPTPLEGQGEQPKHPEDMQWELFELVRDHPGQRREKMERNPKLDYGAMTKAEYAHSTKTYTHEDKHGCGSNWWARENGLYNLPDWYPKHDEANNIESMVMRRLTPQHAFDAWLNSPGHRKHLLGELDFYKQQTQIGIGYVVVDAKGNGYWLFWSAHPER
jgi:uncharacterized protein YkwD